MRVVGLITEYNPFHNGHLHHLHESLRVANADASVAVMSGHFLQRGEPALVDKWLRTKLALAAGVDLILELPFPFACNSAPHFADGAVTSLSALGVVDALCFGSESGDLRMLEKVAGVLIDQEQKIKTATSARLREGINYPTARSEVLKKFLPEVPVDEVASPNNILGIEYLRALRQSGAKIEPYTIRRIGAGYHDVDVDGAIASATGIRKKIAEGDAVDELVPGACGEILNKSLQDGHHLETEKLFNALQAHLLQGPEELRGIYHISEGLEKRLTDAAMTANSYDELALSVKSKHWTLTRIQRILSYLLMNAQEKEMESFLDTGPLYLRFLGASEKGRKILAKARKQRSLPMINDPVRATNVLRRYYQGIPERALLAEKMLAYDLRATRLYGMLLKEPHQGHSNRDFFVKQ